MITYNLYIFNVQRKMQKGLCKYYTNDQKTVVKSGSLSGGGVQTGSVMGAY